MSEKGVLTRPWVLMELHTALTSGVPIVTLCIPTRIVMPTHFDEEIKLLNPGAAQMLVDMGVDPVDCAYLL